MRINRLFSILLLLQLHQQITTRELAKRLEVSERTIHRDMEVLSSEGFPVYAEKGKYGGWRLLDDYKPKVIHLNQEEMPVLFLPLPEKIQKDLGIEKDIEFAQMKLLSLLPQNTKKSAKNMIQRIYLDSSNWHPIEENQSLLPSLQSALWQDRKIWIEYVRYDKEIRKRLINPLGLVAKGTSWYLVASIHDELRTYRVDRIKQVEITEESFDRPPQFCLASYWKQSMKQFVERLPQYHVIVRVKSTIFQQLTYSGRFPKIEILEQVDREGWMKLSMQFQIEQEACSYIMGFGRYIEVIEPKELQLKVKRLAKEIITLYAGSDL